MKANSIIAVLLLLVGLVSCSPDGTCYSEFKAIDNAGWEKSKPLLFHLPDSLPVATCDIKLSLRHDNYYPYRNLWLTVDYVAGGKAVERESVNVELADKYGNWYGSGLGKLLQQSVVLRRSVPVGKYEAVIINHNMRCDTVVGISDVGIMLSVQGK